MTAAERAQLALRFLSGEPLSSLPAEAEDAVRHELLLCSNVFGIMVGDVRSILEAMRDQTNEAEILSNNPWFAAYEAGRASGLAEANERLAMSLNRATWIALAHEGT